MDSVIFYRWVSKMGISAHEKQDKCPKEYIYLRGLYQVTKFPSALGYCVRIKNTLPQLELNILESVNGNIDLLARLDFLDQVGKESWNEGIPFGWLMLLNLIIICFPPEKLLSASLIYNWF